MLELQQGAQLRGKLLAGDSLFHYRFCCHFTSDKYRIDLVLFDCQKGQQIGLTFLQPKFEQEPQCASILGITRKSYELPESTRHLCKGLCVFSQIAHKFLHVSSGSGILGCLGEVGGSTDSNWELRGKVVPWSICSSTCPSSPCALPEGLDPQCMSPSSFSTAWMHVGTIPNHVLSHVQNQEPGGFRQPFSAWQSPGCTVGFAQPVWFSFCMSSGADNLSLCHCYDTVILGMLMRSNQNTVQCTASARWWMTMEV